MADGAGSPAYLVGLLLAGRRVVVVGAGRVAARRVPRLVEAGAVVEVIAPAVRPDLQALADSGALTLRTRRYRAGDLAGAWYALALTDAAEVNAAVVAEAEAGHTFCVRADRADEGSAWTPASGHAEGSPWPPSPVTIRCGRGAFGIGWSRSWSGKGCDPSRWSSSSRRGGEGSSHGLDKLDQRRASTRSTGG